jgi:ABC-type uncharacterized transport system substrate-binding protein
MAEISKCMNTTVIIWAIAFSLMFITADCYKAPDKIFIVSIAGNITGIRSPDLVPKALEWLRLCVLNIKKFYVPYNPDDDISVAELAGLDKTADQMGIELDFHKVHSVEENHNLRISYAMLSQATTIIR